VRLQTEKGAAMPMLRALQPLKSRRADATTYTCTVYSTSTALRRTDLQRKSGQAQRCGARPLALIQGVPDHVGHSKLGPSIPLVSSSISTGSSAPHWIRHGSPFTFRPRLSAR